MINLEEYFNFLAPDDIRLKGTRVGIETILFDYIFNPGNDLYIVLSILKRLGQLAVG